MSCDGGNHFIDHQGDLNSNAGGATIHLYYTTDLFPDNRAVTSISFNGSQDDAVPANGSGSGYDLNDGCGSGTYYIYMHVGTATAVPPTLTVAASDTTMGSVTGGGSYAHGTTATLTATPAPCYHFDGWMEADTVYSRTADTVVAATADRTLTAYFSINLYTVSAVSDNDTMGTVSAGGVDINETFDTYNVGDRIAADAAPDCRMQWTTWDFTPGGPDDGTVATLDGNKCAHFVRGNDQVLLFGDRTMGVYDFAFDMLVPNGKNGFFALVHNFDANSAHNAVQAYQHVTRTGNNRNSTPGHGSLDAAGTNRADIPCIYDAWMHFRIHVDIDGDSAEFYVTHPGQSETFVYKWQWSRYYGGTRSSSAFGGVDFYPPVDSATSEFYVDNITLSGPSDLQAVQHGDLRLLSATPNPGYHFVEWREADTVYSRSADTVVTVTGDRSFTAVFAPDMADLVLTNVSYTRFSQDKLRVEYQFVNQGEVDYTEPIGFTVYRNHYRGEVLGGGPRMVIDEDMLASSGNVATRSYIFYKAPICSLDPDDSLVIAINDMGFGVGRHAGAQPERDTLNNIAVLHINDVYPYRHAYSVDVQAACDSLTWIDDSTYRASTDTAFITVVQNYNSTPCDSIVRLDLTINHSTTGDTSAVVCDSMQWYGETYTASAEPTRILEAASAAGCDSTVTLHLTVNYSNASDTTAVACDSLVWYGVTYASSTSTASHISTNVAGCDSTVTLHLTVNYSNTGDTTAVACDSLVWYGATYASSTSTASHTMTNAAGCDSTVTLNLTVNYSSTGDTTAVECDVFGWYDSIYTSSTSTASHTSVNAVGCDSTVTLHLTINYKNTGDTTAVECDQFSWWEHTDLTESVDTLTHFFEAANQWGCDSTVTLHLTINYKNTGDTTAVECDQFSWWEHTGLTASVDTLTHFFESGNRWGCDSTVTLHLTVNYQNTGDTTAVECDQFSWWEHTGLTASVDTLTHLLVGGNQWGCDSTVTLHLTVNYQNTGDTTAVECDQFSWWEHTGLTSSVDTLTHLLVGGNQWGCDSTVTLHLTVNYQNTGDTAAVECDQFSWWEHTGLTASIDTLTHRFVAANQWGCDSTVTLDLTVNYSNTGDTNAVECDQFSWYEHQNLTASSNNLTHTHLAANQVNCDSTVTLHLTIHYQNTGDTNALTYEPYTWYEHQAMDVTQNVQHLFVGANRWGCDSTVTLHLRYALFATDWAGPTTVIYNSEQQSGLGATYVDDTGRTQQVTLTFTNGSEVITSPNYPVDAGVWNVVARPVLPVDSLYGATTTLTILPATVYVTGAEAYIAKVYDRNTTAVVTNAGTLNNIQGDDALTHTTAASFNDPSIGEGKTITLTYTLHGTPELLNNYVIDPATEVYTTVGAIVDTILPARPNAFDVAVYGYCVGTGSIGYRLSSGNPDQYKLDYADSNFTDVDWTAATGATGTLAIDVPDGLPTGDYTVTVTFRESRFPWIESTPMTVTFHVDLPATVVKPLFDNVIAVVDTCQCFSDIQWYHRAGSTAEWQAIPGANGYYYREENGLTGEYFISAKMNGIPTYTCPQGDFVHLVSDDEQDPVVTAYPNPTSTIVTLSTLHSQLSTHELRVISTVGVELERRTFEGATTTLDMSTWPRGSYIVSVDGMVVRVVKN